MSAAMYTETFVQPSVSISSTLSFDFTFYFTIEIKPHNAIGVTAQYVCNCQLAQEIAVHRSNRTEKRSSFERGAWV